MVHTIKLYASALFARHPILYTIMLLTFLYIIISSISTYVTNRNLKIKTMDERKTEFILSIQKQIEPLQKDLTSTIEREEKLSNKINTLTQCLNWVKDTIWTLDFYDCNKEWLLPKANAEEISWTGNGNPEVAVPERLWETNGMKGEPVLLTGARIVNEITIHNTETWDEWLKTIRGISSWHKYRLRESVWCYGYSIWYHYIIWKDGTVYKTRCETEIWYHNSKNNWTSIWIALMGNFNNENPTDAQYEATRKLIQDIKTRHNINNVTWHWWWWSSCPWKNFNPSRILEPKLWKYLWVYGITRYYTPVRWQRTYLWSKNFESAFKLNCMYKPNRPYGWCLDTASGYRLKPEDAFKMAACPPNLKHNTKLFIEWLGEVTCVDRWWAIKNKRLDIWAWIWDQWIKNLSIKNGWQRKVYLLN